MHPYVWNYITVYVWHVVFVRTIYPELKEQLKELRKHLIESTNEMAPLKVWQMQGECFWTGGTSAIYIKCLLAAGVYIEAEGHKRCVL